MVDMSSHWWVLLPVKVQGVLKKFDVCLSGRSSQCPKGVLYQPDRSISILIHILCMTDLDFADLHLLTILCNQSKKCQKTRCLVDQVIDGVHVHTTSAPHSVANFSEAEEKPRGWAKLAELQKILLLGSGVGSYRESRVGREGSGMSFVFFCLYFLPFFPFGPFGGVGQVWSWSNVWLWYTFLLVVYY